MVFSRERDFNFPLSFVLFSSSSLLGITILTIFIFRTFLNPTHLLFGSWNRGRCDVI